MSEAIQAKPQTDCQVIDYVPQLSLTEKVKRFFCKLFSRNNNDSIAEDYFYEDGLTVVQKRLSEFLSYGELFSISGKHRLSERIEISNSLRRELHEFAANCYESLYRFDGRLIQISHDIAFFAVRRIMEELEKTGGKQWVIEPINDPQAREKIESYNTAHVMSILRTGKSM